MWGGHAEGNVVESFERVWEVCHCVYSGRLRFDCESKDCVSDFDMISIALRAQVRREVRLMR